MRKLLLIGALFLSAGCSKEFWDDYNRQIAAENKQTFERCEGLGGIPRFREGHSARNGNVSYGGCDFAPTASFTNGKVD